MSVTTYYKSVRLNGTDWHTGMVEWAPPPNHEGEWIVRHPTATKIGSGASEYLSVSTVATDCVGMEWPCRLLTVEAVGGIAKPSPTTLPHKRAGVAFRVTGELPADIALGPQGVHVVALLERTCRLTPDEARALASTRNATAWGTAWDTAGDAARDAARDAALGVARHAAAAAAGNVAWGTVGADAPDTVWSVTMNAARAVARALVVRDLIPTDQYNTLSRAWRTVIGSIHPDDPDAILADPESHPIHKDYARINIGIRDRGERWAKCLNCGSPYQITKEWTSETVCSEQCGEEFSDYLM